MENNKIHTPDGVKDILPEELAFKISIERKFESIFNSYNYPLISSPTYEFMEVFDDKGSVSHSQIFKFHDRDGATLALRSDMTPAIARIAATSYSKDDMPLRFSYLTNTFRNNESYQGKLKEITQAGIELIGVDSDEATAEVIAIAVQSLLASGLTDFRIDIGSVKFFKALLEDTNFNEDEKLAFQTLILEKDFVSAEKMINGSDIKKEIKDIFRELPFLIGGQEILENVRKVTSNSNALKAISQLETISGYLNDYGLSKYILYDLSMIGYLDYYTDIIFSGYAFGAATSIIDGGRYDALLSKFGCDYPSVGFAIKIDILLPALERINKNLEIVKSETLITYTKEGRKTAIQTADSLRKTGINIENGFETINIRNTMKYAKNKGFGGILNFIDSEKVEIIDLNENETKIVNISEVLG